MGFRSMNKDMYNIFQNWYNDKTHPVVGWYMGIGAIVGLGLWVWFMFALVESVHWNAGSTPMWMMLIWVIGMIWSPLTGAKLGVRAFFYNKRLELPMSLESELQKYANLTDQDRNTILDYLSYHMNAHLKLFM